MQERPELWQRLLGKGPRLAAAFLTHDVADPGADNRLTKDARYQIASDLAAHVALSDGRSLGESVLEWLTSKSDDADIVSLLSG